MAKEQPSNVPVVNPELQKSLNIILSSKQEIDKIGNACLQIKVVDESTLAVGMQNLSKANDMVKFIEEKRKEVKQPHLDNCRLIDETCKELSDSVTKAVAHLKEEIKQFEIKREQEKEKERLERERKLNEEKERIEAEAKRKEKLGTYVRVELAEFCKKRYEDLKTQEDCDKLITTLNTKWPGVEKLQEFVDEANQIRDNYVSLINIKKQQFADADNMSEDQKQLIKDKEDLIKQKEAIMQKEREIKAREESIAAEKARKEAEEKAAEEERKIAMEQASQKTAKIRKPWKFELVDQSKLIPEWITLNENSVKEYLKENKDKIKNGEVINGVRFFQDISITA